MWARLRRPGIGLDIGSAAIRAVALSRNRRQWSIHAYGQADVPIPAGDEPRPGEWETSDAIGRLLERRDLARGPVTAAIESQTAVVRRVTLPLMSPRELRRAIRWEAQSHVPFDLEDAHVDCHVLPRESARDGASLDVLLVAARKSDIEARALLVRRAGRALAVLDVEAFALVNAYSLNYPERSDPLTMLVHLNRSGAIACLLARRHLVWTRDLFVRGRELAAEVRTAIESHAAESDTTRGRVVVSGEACTSEGAIDSLEAGLAAPVEVFDPFRRLVRRTSDAGTEPGDPSYAIAVGLAMRRKRGR
jgi:type IV pilus assembly protein PilM